MEDKKIVSDTLIELEISIKLLEYLRRNSVINDGMYNFGVNKLTQKLELEKSKIDENYIKEISNYKILT